MVGGRPYRRGVSTTVSSGTVHRLPADLRWELEDHDDALTAWQDITRLARNEFICRVLDAKQDETRARRVRRTRELQEGNRLLSQPTLYPERRWAAA